MSAYTDQEELDKLKVWFKTYGSSLIVGVLLGVAILFGYRYWNDQREAQREAASALYDQLLEQLQVNKPEARAVGEQLVAEYTSTPYAGMAALLMARQAYESGDKSTARQRLEWAVANARDDAVHVAASLRLARVLLESADLDGAVAATAKIKHAAGFESELDELKGDIALAQGQRDAARGAYRDALKQAPAGSPYAALLAMKLDDLGTGQ